MGNTAKQCRLGLFQDSDFAGDLEVSKSTSGGTLCVFGSHTFVPISWMCKKQTAVTYSSTESEIISLDTGLRLDGLPALELWDLIVSVLGNVSRVSDESRNLTSLKCVGNALTPHPCRQGVLKWRCGLLHLDPNLMRDGFSRQVAWQCRRPPVVFFSAVMRPIRTICWISCGPSTRPLDKMRLSRFFILLQLDRSQLTAVCCNRRRV